MAEDQKSQTLKAFQQILDHRKTIDSKIITKTQEADQERNTEVLELASTYSSDRIVKGLANLQLEFGSIVSGLSEKLAAEVSKLDTLECGIQIEMHRLQTLRQLRVVADALHLLTQENQESLNALERTATEQRTALDNAMTQKRLLWSRTQQEVETAVQEKAERLVRERGRENSDYQYNFERTQTIAANEYAEKKRQQEQSRQATHQTNEQQWAEREQILTQQQPLLKDYQQKVSQFSKALEESVQKAHATSIETIQRDATVKAELLEKDWDSRKQGYELKIQSLEMQIQRQTQQMEQIHRQLQETLNQSHALTLKAFGTSSPTRESELLHP
jgi:hypothetical protein